MTFLSRTLIALIGVALLVAPTLFRLVVLDYPARTYDPPAITPISLAATPIPTATPQAVALRTEVTVNDRGPVVVDLAHANSVNPVGVQPLADALAPHGIGVRFWFSTIDPLQVTNYLAYPDQSKALAEQLQDASALVVISPYFLWTPEEIVVAERFVADGGRLLLISDPDIFGDFAAVTNLIAEPYGIVFNDDYLYDTTINDENYTYFFQHEFRDQAADLNGARIAFYGGRSISGAVEPQAISELSTLSSLRVGATGFTTMAIGGVAARNTAGRVLALSDFEVLSEPYVRRHDNHQLVGFVADFLAADQRINLVADFPNYLRQSVALTVDSAEPLGGEILLLGAQLQKRLEVSNRTLSLTQATALTDSTLISPTTDLIYLANYEAADPHILQAAGLQVSEELLPTPTGAAAAATLVGTATLTTTAPTEPPAQASPDQFTRTPTPTRTQETPASTPTPTPSRADREPTRLRTPVSATGEPTTTVASPITRTASITDANTPTVTVTVTSTSTPTPVPATRWILTSPAGMRLLADQTVTIVQARDPETARLTLAVLAADAKGIRAGVTRLLENNFAECITGDLLTYCPIAPESSSAATPSRTPRATETSRSTPAATGEATPTPNGNNGNDEQGGSFRILLVDDNQEATEDEIGEADTYLQGLLAGGYPPDLHSTSENGLPTGSTMANYRWVIWSNAGYGASTLTPQELTLLTDYLTNGGVLTISSRNPLFGAGAGSDAASAVRDLVVESSAGDLVEALPTTPILLGTNLPNAVPLLDTSDEPLVQVVLRRGPTSEDAGVPAVIALADTSSDARLQVSGIALNWLPEEVAHQLIQNLAEWAQE